MLDSAALKVLGRSICPVGTHSGLVLPAPLRGSPQTTPPEWPRQEDQSLGWTGRFPAYLRAFCNREGNNNHGSADHVGQLLLCLIIVMLLSGISTRYCASCWTCHAAWPWSEALLFQFVAEDTEAQRGEAAFPRSHS